MRESGTETRWRQAAGENPPQRSELGGERRPQTGTISLEAGTVSFQPRVYFAETLEAALALARRELGPEALLIEAGPAAEQEASRGAYRVVCAAGNPGPPAESGASQGLGRTGGKSTLREEDHGRRLERLERALDLLAAAVSRGALPEELREPARMLEFHDFPPMVAQELLAGLRTALPAAKRREDGGPCLELLAEEICRRIQFRPRLEAARQPAIVVFAGPPGAGKTSALVKVAMREAVARHRTASIVSTDGFRVAASEQLRTYATILGLPFAMAETPGALRQALAESAGRDLVLIDTPGFGPGERDWAAEWAAMLEGLPGRETQLVLPANLRTTELLEAVDWWRLFSPTALLFTRLDETVRIGGWATAAMESSLPLSFFSTGQRIPEDLENASEQRVWEGLGARRRRAAAAGSIEEKEP